ncbi:MAG: hypothetical protein HQ559_01710 [Lentisphaerae bacterium]|nr:hypothetical protein [Lentisphaerota bacterium]
MIRVTVELVSAVTGEVSHLGTAKIYNDGTGTKTRGNYGVRLSKWGRPNALWKSGELRSFPRLAAGAWDLLFLALKSALTERRIKRVLKMMEKTDDDR